MRRIVARVLRRLADSLDPVQPIVFEPNIHISFDGKDFRDGTAEIQHALESLLARQRPYRLTQ